MKVFMEQYGMASFYLVVGSFFLGMFSEVLTKLSAF